MSRTTILVVDDQPHTRAFIRAILERRGCRILEAGDEASAWAAMQQADSPVSLALIDVDLPGLGGSEVSQMLQALQQVPVLFMSGHERDALIAEGRLDPAADMLSKPFTVNGLIGAIHERLEAARV
jgi:two-component system OmpR family response regulator